MRLNLKIALCLVIIGAFFTTVSYWTKCGDVQPLQLSSAASASLPHASFSVLSRLTQSRAFLGKYSLQEFSKDEAYGDEVGGVGSNSLLSSAGTASATATSEIDCVINGEYTVSCRREGAEVFVPFTFLHKYFEVYGKLSSSATPADGPSRQADTASAVGGSGAGGNGPQERFEWQHSYSKYYVPRGKYDPQGVFMNFENFNVEARDRVKCISAIEGVPVSTQWDVRGYLYPIQIAQFALSHFSKNRTEPKPRTTVYEDGLVHQASWSTPTDGYVSRSWDADGRSEVLNFKTTTESLQDGGASLPFDQTSSQELVLSVNLRLASNGSVTIVLEDQRDHRDRHYLHYVYSDVYISLGSGSGEGSNHIYYGLGSSSQQKWTRLTRDLMVDIRKGVAFAKTQIAGSRKLAAAAASATIGRSSHTKWRLLAVVLRGQGSLDNLTLSTSAHVTHFLDGADWLLRHQDSKGGWPIPVERKFMSSSGMGNLAPGWYSAMAQGQAMSALTRAYHATGNRRYLTAAARAVRPFQVDSERNGVAATFLDKYVWYEEYPTVPSSFVLNGFVYSLIGLYDLKSAYDHLQVEDQSASEARSLYERGMNSLRTLLPLFDSGVGSFYDLRHFTLGIAPNLARWDYHTTHIGQLLLLATVDDAPILRTTADRWIDYMKGKRAPHN